MDSFKRFLEEDGKSVHTISNYERHISAYKKWFNQTFGSNLSSLYKENILDYKSYLLNIRKLNAKSINASLAAISKFNEFLISTGVQDNVCISKKDYIKVQLEYASPSIIGKNDVEGFRQKILENENIRDYAIVTLLAYSGLRISEALKLKLNDINLIAKEIVVRYGKGAKQRIVYINDKIVNAIKSYLKERGNYSHKDSEYLFISRESGKVDKSVINRVFKRHSDKITPHTLRHFFCSHALENGWSVHEVASQAGHTNIHTTLLYTNPSKEKMKQKANLL